MSQVAAQIEEPTAKLQARVDNIDWEQADADTRYLTHDLHRYSGKFIPQIASSAVQLLSRPGDLVVDPYAGSGTTLLEAGLNDRRCLGVDLNPLAVLIAQAKTTNMDPVQLASMQDRLAGVASLLTSGNREVLPGLTPDPQWQEVAERDPRRHDPWFTKWFEDQVLTDLLTLDAAIEALPTMERSIGRVALSNILRKSSRAHSGYPNVMFDRQAPPRSRPGSLFMASLQRCVVMISALPKLSGVTAKPGDARNLPLADESADAVVTHPPYIGSVPYAEYGLISLKWFGHDPKSLDASLTGGRRQTRDVVERFELAYVAAVREAYRVLKVGGGMFLMVGRPVVRGETIDLAAMSRSAAIEAGFHLTAGKERTGVNRRANKMGAEALLFFEKS